MADGTSAATHRRPDYGTISVLGWAHFLNDGAANYLPGILPAVLLAMGLDKSMAGTLMGALLIGQALQPLTGILADRLGGRSLTLIGLAGSSICGGLVAFTPNLWTLVIVLLLIGTFNAFFHPQTISGVRQASGDRLGSGMSVFLVGGEVGRGIWPYAASGLVVVAGLSRIWVLALPGLLMLPFLWYFAPKVPARTKQGPRVRWREHLRPLSVLVAFCGLRGMMLYSIVTYVPELWHENGGSLDTGAAFITVLMLVGIVGNLSGGRMGDRVGRRRIITLGMVIAILAMVGYIFASGVWLWILIAVVGIGIFATLPLTVVIGQDMVPENPSFGAGMALGLANAIGAIGVMILGLLAGAYGSTSVLWAGVACGILSLPVLALLPKTD